MVRFILELVVGVVVAAIITAVVMVTMFYLGPWADPPGINETLVAAGCNGGSARVVAVVDTPTGSSLITE